MTAICKVPGCARPIRERGLCAAHYHRWWMSGESAVRLTAEWLTKPLDWAANQPYHQPERCEAPCSPPCERKAKWHGLCSGHAMRRQRGQRIDTPLGKHGQKVDFGDI